jgi:hypothetical protein
LSPSLPASSNAFTTLLSASSFETLSRLGAFRESLP